MTQRASTDTPPRAKTSAYSLQEIPARRRFQTMREMMADGHPPFMRAVLTATRDDEEAPFDGGFVVHVTGELTMCEHFTEPVRYERTARGVATSPIETYGLHYVTEGEWHLSQGGRSHVLRPGSMVLLESDVPFQSVKPARTAQRVIRIPRERIDALMVPGWQQHALYCSDTPGLGALLTRYIQALTDEMDRLDAPAANEVLAHICRLLALYADGHRKDAPPAEPALAAARLMRIRRYIEANLRDPDLTPASVAAAHRMSVRSLHQLFEPTGISFSKYVTRRRLQESLALLKNPLHARRSVTDIAFSCGFNSLSAFYRVFQNAFGAAPGDVRSRLGTGVVTSHDGAREAVPP